MNTSTHLDNVDPIQGRGRGSPKARAVETGNVAARGIKDQQRQCDHDHDWQDDNAKIFPQRLMKMLLNDENHEAITWLAHGKAFIILNREKFATTVLPQYFRKTKFTSFTRKLNRWNFTRISHGPDLGAFYHEFFQRDNEALCAQMYCNNDRAKFALSKKHAPLKDADVPLAHTTGQGVDVSVGPMAKIPLIFKKGLPIMDTAPTYMSLARIWQSIGNGLSMQQEIALLHVDVGNRFNPFQQSPTLPRMQGAPNSMQMQLSQNAIATAGRFENPDSCSTNNDQASAA